MSIKKLLICAVLGGALASAASAETVKPTVTKLDFEPQRILAIGNSYTYYNCGLNLWLGGLIRSSINPKLKTRIAATGYANLSQQPIAEMLDNDLLASHTENSRSMPEDLKKLELKKRENYDLVILQGSNRGIDDQTRDNYYIGKHIEAIRSQGGTPVLMATWVQKRKGAPPQDLVLNEIQKMANKHGIMAVPVGAAFAAAEKALPDVKLIMADNTHPTAAGSYLMAATLFAAIYGKNPEIAASFKGGCQKELPAQLRADLSQIAWKTISERFGIKNK